MVTGGSIAVGKAVMALARVAGEENPREGDNPEACKAMTREPSVSMLATTVSTADKNSNVSVIVKEEERRRPKVLTVLSPTNVYTRKLNSHPDWIPFTEAAGEYHEVVLAGTPLQAVRTLRNWVRIEAGMVGEKGAYRLTLTTRPTMGVKVGVEDGVVEGLAPEVSVGVEVRVEVGVFVGVGQLVELKERDEVEDLLLVVVGDEEMVLEAVADADTPGGRVTVK